MHGRVLPKVATQSIFARAIAIVRSILLAGCGPNHLPQQRRALWNRTARNRAVTNELPYWIRTPFFLSRSAAFGLAAHIRIGKCPAECAAKSLIYVTLRQPRHGCRVRGLRKQAFEPWESVPRWHARRLALLPQDRSLTHAFEQNFSPRRHHS
jgi:hypothetical protein